MTDLQLYLAIGMPTFAVLIGILMNNYTVQTINSCIASLEVRLDGRISTEVGRLENQNHSLLTKFDILTGKVVEIDNRLTRLEERLKIS